MGVTFRREPCSSFNNMKNSSLPIQAFLAVLAAAIILPVSAGATFLALTMAGALAVLAADYGREVAPLRAQAPVVPFGRSSPRQAALDEAA
jgi:hypothetical protein